MQPVPHWLLLPVWCYRRDSMVRWWMCETRRCDSFAPSEILITLRPVVVHSLFPTSPKGRYNPSVNAQDCIDCPKGRYGNQLGLTASTCTAACPKGRFGDSTGLTSAACSGDCPVGRYGSTKGITTASCTGLCPKGTYGATTGLTSAACSGECDVGHFGDTTGMTVSTCSGPWYGNPRLSLSIPVSLFPPALTSISLWLTCLFYSVLFSNIGSYGSTTGLTTDTCSGLCPAGRYGADAGLTTSACSGLWYVQIREPPNFAWPSPHYFNSLWFVASFLQ